MKFITLTHQKRKKLYDNLNGWRKAYDKIQYLFLTKLLRILGIYGNINLSKWSLLKKIKVYLRHAYNFLNLCNRWKLLWYKSGIWRVYWLRRDPRKLSQTVKIFCILTGMVIIWRYVFIRTHWITYLTSCAFYCI